MQQKLIEKSAAFIYSSPMRPTIQVLDEPTIQHILSEAKQILGEIGLEIQGATLRRRLLEHGLHEDANSRILFPPRIVDQAVATAPNSFTLYNRQGQPHAQIGGNKVHFVPGSSALNILDRHTGQIRPAATADFIDYVRLAHGLPHIAYLATAFSTSDVALEIADAWRLYLCLIHSPKPVVSGTFTAHGVPRMAEMMQLFRRDRADLRARPFSIFTITPSGSFSYGEDSCQNLLDCAAWGIPIEITPVTFLGLNAPVTLVEAAVFHTADVLAGLTMAQLLSPSLPVLFGGAPAAFHMKTAVSAMSAIEAQQLNMAYVAVGKHLNLPTQAYMALSDAKELDAQAGAETFASALLAALAGINSVSGPGMLDYVKCFSLPKLVLDDELCGQALHFIRESEPEKRGTAVSLARELLQEKQLMIAEHTLSRWREHLYLPGPVIDRQNRDKWAKAGSPSLLKRAAAEVEKKLAAYEPITTDPQTKQELRRLLESGLEKRSIHDHSPSPPAL